MADPPRQPTIPTEPAWVRLCRWLWKGLRWFWGAILLVVIINLFTSWLFVPLGTSFSRTPLGTLPGHPLPFFLGGVGLLGLTGGLWLINRLHPAPASQKTSPRLQAILLTREDRRRLLERLGGLYQDYMKRSLDMPRMELGLERTFEATAHPALSVSYQPAGVREAIAPSTPILDVYQEAGDGLLILGKPGAGKSTLLYDLALALTERAERDTTQLPPVLVSLTSWAEKRLPLVQWLAEELQQKYQIQRTLATGWLLADQLLPLLDGLDELAEEARAACIEAINTYRRDHPLPIVVSSRSAEYLSQERKLHLQSAIEVQLLTPQQVDGYLKGEGKPLAAVRAALRRDAVLRDLVTTPLMLSVVMRVYRGKTVKDLPHLGTAEERQRQVFERYVTRMLEPTAKPTRKWRSTSDSDSTQKWLTWLAQQMQQHNQREFYLEQLDQSWFANKHLGISIAVVIGIFYWLISTLFIGPAFALVNGLLSGLLFGLFPREPSEVMTLSWKQVKRGDTVWDLFAGLIFGGAVFVGIGPAFGLTLGLIFGLVSGGVVWLACESMDAVSGTQLDARSRLTPNQGTWRSAQNGLIFGLLIGPGVAPFFALILGSFLWLVFTLLHWSVNQLVSGLFSRLVYDPPFQLPSELFLGILLVLLFILLTVPLVYGIDTFLEHFILRFLLWRKGHLPWNMVAFLDEAAERLLLRKVGGGYIFLHPLLQEYFASLGTGISATT